MAGTSEYNGTSLVTFTLPAGSLAGNPTTSTSAMVAVTPSADFTFSGTSFAVSGGSMVKSNSSLTLNIQRLTNIVDGTSGLVVPAGYFIDNIALQNTTGNIITGGIKIGTTTGGLDVLTAIAVGANSFLKIPDVSLLKTGFSITAAQTLFVQTVTLWNSANINLTMYCLPL